MNKGVLVALIIAMLAALGWLYIDKKDTGMTNDMNEIENTEESNTDKTVAGKETTNALASKAWVWTGGTVAGEAVAPTTIGDFVASFSADGQFNSSTDCNSLAGSYTAGPDDISFGPLAATKMACIEETQEEAFSAALATMERYVVSETTLVLSNGAGDNLEFQVQ